MKHRLQNQVPIQTEVERMQSMIGMMPSPYPIITSTGNTFTGLALSSQAHRSRWTVDGARDGVCRILAARRPPLPPRRRRVARYLLNLPRRFDLYFRDRPGRRWMWRFNTLGMGFLSGNTVSLTFGTLAVNDVLAAIITAVFYMVVSDIYWSAKRKTYRLELLNIFKNGVVLALLADAFKLGG